MKTLAQIRDEEAMKMADINFDKTAFNTTQVRLINNIAIAYAQSVLSELLDMQEKVDGIMIVRVDDILKLKRDL